MTHPSAHEILVSPDGRLRAVFLATERAPGAWSHSPRVIDQTGGVVLIDLWDSEWDAVLEWLENGKVRLDLNRYGRAEWCALILDPETRTFELFDRDGSISGRDSGAAALHTDPRNAVAARGEP